MKHELNFLNLPHKLLSFLNLISSFISTCDTQGSV